MTVQRGAMRSILTQLDLIVYYAVVLHQQLRHGTILPIRDILRCLLHSLNEELFPFFFSLTINTLPMALDENTIKTILVVMGLPYIIVTIFLLLTCFKSIADKFANWSDVYGDYTYNYKWPDMERFEDGTKEIIKKMRSRLHPKRTKAMRPVKPREPVQPEQQDNQDQVFSKKVGESAPSSPLYFFDTPGICQQTRFNARDSGDDSGRGIYGKRRELSAMEYLEFYNSPYY